MTQPARRERSRDGTRRKGSVSSAAPMAERTPLCTRRTAEAKTSSRARPCRLWLRRARRVLPLRMSAKRRAVRWGKRPWKRTKANGSSARSSLTTRRRALRSLVAARVVTMSLVTSESLAVSSRTSDSRSRLSWKPPRKATSLKRPARRTASPNLSSRTRVANLVRSRYGVSSLPPYLRPVPTAQTLTMW